MGDVAGRIFLLNVRINGLLMCNRVSCLLVVEQLFVKAFIAGFQLLQQLFYSPLTIPTARASAFHSMCVFVCVCAREREERTLGCLFERE